MIIQVQKIKSGDDAGKVRLSENGKELALLTRAQANSLGNTLIAATQGAAQD